jgi:hypothetical protein
MFRYLPVMKEFMTMGSVRLGEMEDLFTDMKSRVRRGPRVRFKLQEEFFNFYVYLFATCVVLVQ